MIPPDCSLETFGLRAGHIVGDKYLLLAPLAVGGMGQVWTARNLATSAEVAVKLMLPALVTREGQARFRREAQATATLSHRAIVRVFDLIEMNSEYGSLVMVMELLHGHTLAQEIARSGPLSVEETLSIVSSLLSALTYAHGMGIVHRDLKPDNVFLAIEPDGQRMPKIVDFGISKHLRASPITLDGEIVGTFNYMSPEQTLGSCVDGRSDIFAIGILLYECLSGRNPFTSADFDERHVASLMSVFDIEPLPLQNIPAPLWDVIRRALALKAEERFATAGELAGALFAAVPTSFFSLPPAPSPPSAPSLSFPPVQLAPPFVVPLASAPPRRQRGPLIAVGVTLSILGLAAASVVHMTSAPSPSVSVLVERASSLPHFKRLVDRHADVLAAAPPPESPPEPIAARVDARHAPAASPRIPQKTWFTPVGPRAAPRATASVAREPGF